MLGCGGGSVGWVVASDQWFKSLNWYYFIIQQLSANYKLEKSKILKRRSKCGPSWTSLRSFHKNIEGKKYPMNLSLFEIGRKALLLRDGKRALFFAIKLMYYLKTGKSITMTICFTINTLLTLLIKFFSVLLLFIGISQQLLTITGNVLINCNSW